MNKKVAILGSTGLIGEAVYSFFLDRKVDIKACSFNGGNIRGIKIEAIDISKSNQLKNWLEGEDIETIIYLAAKIPNSFLEADFKLFIKNYKMHKKVLDYWRHSKCHLLYASGSSVYGPNSSIPWKENNITLPDNYYSLSKLAGELTFFMEHQNIGLPLTILRINAPYGAKNRRKTVINVFLEKALNQEDIILFGSGNREQDFVYVKDVAKAFWLAYLKKESGIFNIASGETILMKDLASIIKKITGSDSSIVFSGKVDPQEKLKIKIDISKAEELLGFIPDYTIEKGLMKCIEEYECSKE